MRPLPLALAVLLALPAPGAAFPKDEGSTKRAVIHLVFLRDKKGKPAKTDTDKILGEVNAIYEKLGVSARAVLADKSVLGARKEDPLTFAPTSSVAIIGPPAEVKSFLEMKDPKGAGYLDGWEGDNEVERSANHQLFFDGKENRGGGRYIAVDAVAGIPFYQGVLNKARSSVKTTPPWTWEQTAAMIIVHGSGHNADLDFKLDHAEYGGIMTDGKVLDEFLPASECPYWLVTSAAKNPKLITHLKARYK